MPAQDILPVTSKLPVTTFIRDVLAIPTNLVPFPSALKTNILLSPVAVLKSTSSRSVALLAPPPPKDANCC